MMTSGYASVLRDSISIQRLQFDGQHYEHGGLLFGRPIRQGYSSNHKLRSTLLAELISELSINGSLPHIRCSTEETQSSTPVPHIWTRRTPQQPFDPRNHLPKNESRRVRKISSSHNAVTPTIEANLPPY
mgnify:CR=1 FL=1